MISIIVHLETIDSRSIPTASIPIRYSRVLDTVYIHDRSVNLRSGGF